MLVVTLNNAQLVHQYSHPQMEYVMTFILSKLTMIKPQEYYSLTMHTFNNNIHASKCKCTLFTLPMGTPGFYLLPYI